MCFVITFDGWVNELVCVVMVRLVVVIVGVIHFGGGCMLGIFVGVVYVSSF